MTRKGGQKPVDDTFWKGRLRKARAFHSAAQTLSTLADGADAADPIVSEILLAAIAYADALTAKSDGTVNQKDHQAIGQALRAALGNRLPAAQMKRLMDIVREKNAAEYSAWVGDLKPARRLLEQLGTFATWAEEELAR